MPFHDYSVLIANKPEIQMLQSPDADDIQIAILRLDKIHPQVSGNKLFKLTEYLDAALQTDHRTILTFGGPFSNHLAATAFACMKLRLRAIGIVRGEKQNALTDTLAACKAWSMKLHFVPRNEFSTISVQENITSLQSLFGNFITVPAGGYGIRGASGASGITEWIPRNTFTHICVPAGSATTLAGLMMKDRNETIIAFPAIKNMQDIPTRLSAMGIDNMHRLQIINDYHFGGFAKSNSVLVAFMNDFYKTHGIPLDRVYTAKMMYGVTRLIRNNYFPTGSRIVCIHTGGLQGNNSFEKGALIF